MQKSAGFFCCADKLDFNRSFRTSGVDRSRPFGLQGGVHRGPGVNLREHEHAPIGDPHQATAGGHGAVRDADGARRTRRRH